MELALYHASTTLNSEVDPSHLQHLWIPNISNTLHMKNTDFMIIVFSVVTLCSPADRKQHFEGAFCFCVLS